MKKHHKLRDRARMTERKIPLSAKVIFVRDSHLPKLGRYPNYRLLCSGKNINNMAKIKQAYKKEKTAASRT